MHSGRCIKWTRGLEAVFLPKNGTQRPIPSGVRVDTGLRFQACKTLVVSTLTGLTLELEYEIGSEAPWILHVPPTSGTSVFVPANVSRVFCTCIDSSIMWIEDVETLAGRAPGDGEDK